MFITVVYIWQGLGAQAHGGIFLFDFWKPRRGVRALELTGDIDKSTFSPHGISIWTDTNRSKGEIQQMVSVKGRQISIAWCYSPKI